MAKQKGDLKIEGTIHDLTFYRMRNNYFVRAKRNVSRERLLNDVKLARVRENGNEFGLAVKSGKLLRDTVRTMFKQAGSRSTSESMLQVMLRIQKLDTTSERGKRNAGTALAFTEAKKLLKGFEFNRKSQTGRILFKPYFVNITTGEITISDLVTIRDIAWPEGATNVTLRGAYANVNFADETKALEHTNEVNLAIETAATSVILTPASVPVGTGTKIYLLQVSFFQVMNGVSYQLNNGLFNALVIVEVA